MSVCRLEQKNSLVTIYLASPLRPPATGSGHQSRASSVNQEAPQISSAAHATRPEKKLRTAEEKKAI